MSDLIRIQSTKTITVTCGLEHKDVTNPDAHIPDRLKVSAEWPKCTVLIKAGVGDYPAEIAEWPTVKALVKDKVFTIAEAGPAVTDDQKQMVEEFEKKEVSVGKKRKKQTLDEISGDEVK